jgi:ABC-type uncharacterized transport system permease subunit
MERVQGAALARGLAIQTGWLLLSWTCARVLWARGVRNIKRSVAEYSVSKGPSLKRYRP